MSTAFERAACAGCGATGLELVVDLASQPLANAYLTDDDLARMEPHYTLVMLRCGACHLVQIAPAASAGELFSDYLYMSSYSSTWLEHARSYVDAVIERFDLGSRSKVVEVASNDGYLLQFMAERGVPALGIEPAANVAEIANRKGIDTVAAFFGTELATRLRGEGVSADLMIANNVLAHVPEINDFVAGFTTLLAPQGVVTFEFPHLVNLVEQTQFDTIYHEHFSYFSLLAVREIVTRHGLRIFDVERLPTHGGSLRVYACHGAAAHAERPAVGAIIAHEIERGFDRAQRYADFARACRSAKRGLLRFLLDAADQGRSVCAYGAPAKGNTLLNYCGVGTDLVEFTVDRNPHKQGRYLPGTHIPVRAPESVFTARPDYVLVLPWNLREEIEEQMSGIRAWGGRFVVAIPRLTVF